MKTCKRCAMNKSASEFRAEARNVDRLSSWCIECHAAASRAHYQANKSARNAAARAWAQANPEKTKASDAAFKRANKIELAKSYRTWAKQNRAARRAIDARRKAAKRRATPAWADPVAIRAIYAEAVLAQEITGARMHVDHIVPIQSELVCGLHCEANLQVLPGADNEAKRNRWWPDMPGIEEAQKQVPMFPPEPPKAEQLEIDG